jgi:hypothetical protein
MPETFHGSDQEFLEQLNIPGIQRQGGLETARKLAGRPPPQQQ